MSDRRLAGGGAVANVLLLREIMDRLERLEKGGALAGRISLGPEIQIGDIAVSITDGDDPLRFLTFRNVIDGSVVVPTGSRPSVATTLPARDEGSAALIRIGAEPYDYESFVFDPELGLFVSPAETFLTGCATSTSNSATYVDLTADVLVPWRYQAGVPMYPEFRARSLAGTGGATAVTMTLAIALASCPLGGVESAFNAEIGETAQDFAAAQSRLIDTNWLVGQSLPALDDYLVMKIRGKSSNTTNGKTWASLALQLRWVA